MIVCGEEDKCSDVRCRDWFSFRESRCMDSWESMSEVVKQKGCSVAR